MRFLSELNPRSNPTLIRLVHTRRKAVMDETQNMITLYEETLRLTITLPSVIRGLKDNLTQSKAALAQAFAPPFRGWCYVA
jgi:hypothetical protein